MTHNSAGPLPRLPRRELDLARTAYLAALQRFPEELFEAGRRLLERVDGANWALEWSLPYWLGETFGLWREAVRTLTLANVFGLAYARLQDDAVDDELGRDERASSPLLATALYHLWLEQYHKLFDETSLFWRHFDSYMSTWMRSTLRGGVAATGSSPAPGDDTGAMVTVEHALVLAERGAPLKAGGVAACLLAFRQEDVTVVEAAVDHLLAAAVLLDHVQDWREDLAAGRYNAFAAHAAGQWETEIAGGNVQQVAAEIYLGDAGGRYFALVREITGIARREAQSLACRGLVHYVERLEENASAYHTRLAEQAKGKLRDTVTRFLDSVKEPETAPTVPHPS
ncbi:MAG TPA: hypothetical protein ENO23_03150 [Alphaproteobacteria bacterium]|nr:hypothetical protein [Alphaproteobacteria bacterium]